MMISLRPLQGLGESQTSSCMPASCVWVIDNSRGARQAIAEVLHEYGYAVDTAASAQDARRMAAASAYPPDLVLLDFRLDGLRADLLANELRMRWPGMIVLYLTCLGPEHDEALRSALRCPATGLLCKPTSLELVVAAVHALLGDARASAQAPEESRCG